MRGRRAKGLDPQISVHFYPAGEYGVLQNAEGYFAVLCVVDVKARSHGDPFDAITIEYRINPDGAPRL